MREKEMLTDKKRKTIIFLIAVMQNLVFFVVSYFTKLPLWLDTTGTIYISILLGYQFGFCVGLINSLFSALFFYGYHSIIFYLVSFSVAILSDVIYHHINKRKKWIVMYFALSFAGGLCASLLTLIFDNGIPADYWTRNWYNYLLVLKVIPFFSTVISILAMKSLDTLISLLLVGLSIKLTPKRIKTDKCIIQL